MKKPNKINFKEGHFTSCGVKYTVVSESMAYERIVRFIQFIPVLSNGMAFKDFQTHIKKQLQILKSGNNLADNYVKTVEHTLNLFNQIKDANDEDFFQINIDQHLEFCALFCIEEGEDMTVYDKTIMDRKITNWKKDMDLYDFFFLTKTQLPGYKELLEELYSHQNVKEREEAKKSIDKIIN